MSMSGCIEKFRLAGTEERPMNVVYFVLREYFHGKVLDVGCGQGRHLMLMPEDSVGIDLYPNKEMITKYGIVIHNLDNDLPFKNESFDVLFCSHLLEHIKSPYNMLKEFYRCLKPEGTLIIGIPNSNCIYFDFYGLSKESDWSEHLYEWNLKQAIRFITNCGFEVEDTCCNFPFSKRFGKIWVSLPLVKRISADLWFIATKKGEKIYLKPSKRNLLEKMLRKLFGNAMSQSSDEK